MIALLRRVRHEWNVYLCGRENHRWTVVQQTKDLKNAGAMVICARCKKPGWLV